MLHDGTGHDDPYIIPIVEPLPDQHLCVALILVPGDDVMENKPVVCLHLQPAGEEIFGESQCVSFRGAGLDACCRHLLHIHSLRIKTVADGRIKGSGTGVVKVILPHVPVQYDRVCSNTGAVHPARGYGKKQAGFPSAG